MLSPITSVPYSQKPYLPTKWLSGLEGVRYQVQKQCTQPISLIAFAIFAALFYLYVSHRTKQNDAVNQRDLALVDTGTDDAKPLRRVENIGGIARVVQSCLIDPVVSNVLPDEDAMLTSRVLENLEEHSQGLIDYTEQATYSGASFRSAGYNDMPPGFKISKGFGNFAYHDADSIFNLMLGFIVPKETRFKREKNSPPVEVIQQTDLLVKEIKATNDMILKLSRFYGFLVEGAAEASYVSVHPNHRVNSDRASWHRLQESDKKKEMAMNTSVMAFYTITFDRELNYLPEEVRNYLYELSIKYRNLYEHFLPEALGSIQFRLDQVKGAPPPCPPHSQFAKQIKQHISEAAATGDINRV